MVGPMTDGVTLWQYEAQCAGKDTDHFFDDEKSAKKFCAGCPVIQDCLEFALLYNFSGVWGGTSQKDRRKMRKTAKFLRDDCKESGLYNQDLKV